MTRKREREGGREKAGGEDGEDRERERERICKRAQTFTGAYLFLLLLFWGPQPLG
jgi:hypothetical protein